MRKLIALGYMLGFPIALMKVLPGIVTILLFSTAPGAVGVFSGLGIVPGLGITGALFAYFVTGFFPAPAISNWIMGL